MKRRDGPFSAEGRRASLREVPLAGNRGRGRDAGLRLFDRDHVPPCCRAGEALLSRCLDPLIAYAVKANPNSAVIATLARPGSAPTSSRAASIGARRAAGSRREKIVFSGVGKTEGGDARRPSKAALISSTSNWFEEAEMLSVRRVRSVKTAPVGFRVNPDVAPDAMQDPSTGAAENKFGIPSTPRSAAYPRASAFPASRSRASPSISAAS